MSECHKAQVTQTQCKYRKKGWSGLLEIKFFEAYDAAVVQPRARKAYDAAVVAGTASQRPTRLEKRWELP